MDEAHRARRRNLGPTHRKEKADPNNLLRFVRAVAPNTKSLLLATATPVQLDPIEAWDLLDALNLGNETVLGSPFSSWQRHPRAGLDYVLGREAPPDGSRRGLGVVARPLSTRRRRTRLRAAAPRLGLPASASWARPEALERLAPPDRQRLDRAARDFFPNHNPYIRHIVRRTRDYLESTHRPPDQRAVPAAGAGAPVRRRANRTR